RRIGPVLPLDLLLLAVVVSLGWLASRPPEALEVYWSPYQKLTLELPAAEHRFAFPGQYIVRSNNYPCQGIVYLRLEPTRALPDVYPGELEGLSQYDIPCLLQPKPNRVLIVGAGTGNDVAGARRGAAKHITAVEIDPAIIALGKRLHPEKPY